MYVCLCHGVTDREIRQAAADGVREIHVLTMRTGAGSNCGSCLPMAAELLADAVAAQAFPLRILQAA